MRDPTSDSVRPAAPTDGMLMPGTVVLLHGIWMAAATLRPLAARLRAHGWKTETLGYPSIFGDTDRTVARIADRIRGRDVQVVAHSLGGLMAVRALQGARGAKPHRLVCLGTPLAGASAAHALDRRPVLRMWMGRSAPILREGTPTLPPGVEVGMIAGCVPRGLGGVVARFDGDHDGTVAVTDTRVPGLHDHCVVQASHSGLLVSAEVAEQVACFLQDGRFRTEGAACV